jgi:hypothetical protein
MTAQTVVRKVALATSVLEREASERLLASLDPDLADRVRAAMVVVRQRGWNRRELVAGALGDEVNPTSANPAVEASRLYPLAQQMDSVSYARVLAAQEVDQRDFQLSLLDPDLADDVRRQLGAVPELPERLRVATLAAVAALVAADLGTRH